MHLEASTWQQIEAEWPSKQVVPLVRPCVRFTEDHKLIPSYFFFCFQISFQQEYASQFYSYNPFQVLQILLAVSNLQKELAVSNLQKEFKNCINNVDTGGSMEV